MDEAKPEIRESSSSDEVGKGSTEEAARIVAELVVAEKSELCQDGLGNGEQDTEKKNTKRAKGGNIGHRDEREGDADVRRGGCQQNDLCQVIPEESVDALESKVDNRVACSSGDTYLTFECLVLRVCDVVKDCGVVGGSIVFVNEILRGGEGCMDTCMGT